MNTVSRAFPKVLHIGNVVKNLDGSTKSIVDSVLSCGLVHIPAQDLNPKNLFDLAQSIGSIVELPAEKAFGNLSADFPGITCVTNILEDGSIKKNHSAAEYWHQDGQFHKGNRNNIWNILYADIVPETGGETDLCDATAITSIKTEEEIEGLKKMKFAVKTNLISDFADSDVETPDVLHHLTFDHPISKRTTFYFGNTHASVVEGMTQEESQTYLRSIVEQFISNGFFYRHRWAPGDLLIWDNLTTFHRSAGGYGNQARRLYRAQVRMFQ